MPVYNYHCAANERSVEVVHGMREDLTTWGEVRARAGLEHDDTPDDAPVERLLYSPSMHTPMSNTRLKEKGFTKLVRRDKGVYENEIGKSTRLNSSHPSRSRMPSSA